MRQMKWKKISIRCPHLTKGGVKISRLLAAGRST